MNPSTRLVPRLATRPVLLGLSLALAPLTALAQTSYYDPVRDVMVPIIQRPDSPYGATQQAAPAPAPVPQNQFRLLIRNGWLTSGPTQLSVDHGREVTITAESNIGDRLIVDGYGINATLPANQPVVLRFTAQAPGRYEYRLASTGRVIGVLEVGPPAPAAAPAAPAAQSHSSPYAHPAPAPAVQTQSHTYVNPAPPPAVQTQSQAYAAPAPLQSPVVSSPGAVQSSGESPSQSAYPTGATRPGGEGLRPVPIN